MEKERKGIQREGRMKVTARDIFPSRRRPFSLSASGGYTLIELVITITVLTVLTLGIIPLVKTSVRRQKEYRLRETLREMREAIDEFKRDTVGMQCGGAPGGGVPGGGSGGQGYIDPRSKVIISDCTIFGVDNPDRYPPDLETLVNGVSVVQRGAATVGGPGGGQATENNPLLATKTKVYLRAIPVDPITGKEEWCLRSSYDAPGDDCSTTLENVFDVRSKAEGTALNGEKYSDW
jgi:general secretion pathway protein G